MIYPIDQCVLSSDYNIEDSEVSVLSDTSFCMITVEFEERTNGGVEDVCVR